MQTYERVTVVYYDPVPGLEQCHSNRVINHDSVGHEECHSNVVILHDPVDLEECHSNLVINMSKF
jgi:hypothetical protein